MSVDRTSTHFFFFTATATTEIYTLSLHDALPICRGVELPLACEGGWGGQGPLNEDHSGLRSADWSRVRRRFGPGRQGDRKSTRLNSSHANISYAVFCLKKKKMK